MLSLKMAVGIFVIAIGNLSFDYACFQCSEMFGAVAKEARDLSLPLLGRKSRK